MSLVGWSVEIGASWSVVISVLALLVAAASARYTRRGAWHSKRTADVAEATLHDQHTPVLKIWLDGTGPSGQVPQAYYTVSNDGPQDLDEVVVHRPQPSGDVGYWVGHVGQTAEPDGVNLGALAMGREARFTLFYVYGNVPPEALPRFSVPIDCRKGEERWRLLWVLPPPRPAA